MAASARNGYGNATEEETLTNDIDRRCRQVEHGEEDRQKRNTGTIRGHESDCRQIPSEATSSHSLPFQNGHQVIG